MNPLATRSFFLAALISLNAVAVLPKPPKILAECRGTSEKYVRAYVTESRPGGPLTLTLLDNAKVVLAQVAQKRVIENGNIDPRVSRIGYHTGDVLKGGADLRIFTRHPNVKGAGHLTTEVYGGGMANFLMTCSKY